MMSLCKQIIKRTSLRMTNRLIPSQQNVSKQDWQGLQSSKFKGGRFHDNHPSDQLDAVLSGNNRNPPSQGKRQFSNADSSSKGPSAGKLKTFPIKYQKSAIFQTQNINKLIKLPQRSDEPVLLSQSKQQKSQYETIGTSKIKALQKGQKQTGIYRNFYEHLCKSTNMIHNHL